MNFEMAKLTKLERMQKKGRDLSRPVKVDKEYMEYLRRNEDWWNLQAGVRLGKMRISKIRPVR